MPSINITKLPTYSHTTTQNTTILPQQKYSSIKYPKPL
jgi:hypothetical protein